METKNEAFFRAGPVIGWRWACERHQGDSRPLGRWTEVWLEAYGWVPVDPADVRKVVLEEPPGNRALDDEIVKRARQRLFGTWEMNWIAYNCGHDVALPGSKGAPVNYFMYPQAETARGRIDPFDADKFRYEIASREVA